MHVKVSLVRLGQKGQPTCMVLMYPILQRMKDETKDLKAELRVLAPTRISSQSSFNGGSDNNEKRLLHRRCASTA